MKINDSHHIYAFSKENKPVCTIRTGERVEFETMDNLSNMLKRPTDTFVRPNLDRINPATGPVYIEGAMPGDVLEVKIEEIRLKDYASIVCQADVGLLGEYFDEDTFKIIPIQDGKLIFDDKLSISPDPMVGVLGVTPADFDAGMLNPGQFGGNMDNTMMRAGTRVFLPVFVPGALAGVGDVHAVMGDGEVNCSAIEAPAFVTLTFHVHKNLQVRDPLLITEEHLVTVATRDTLDEAVSAATKEMALILKDRLPLPFDELSMLMSAIGNTEICCVVTPVKTARFTMPLYALNAYGFEL